MDGPKGECQLLRFVWEIFRVGEVGVIGIVDDGFVARGERRSRQVLTKQLFTQPTIAVLTRARVVRAHLARRV